jgi:hypothetical protein
MSTYGDGGVTEAMNELASVPRPEYQATGTENR